MSHSLTAELERQSALRPRRDRFSLGAALVVLLALSLVIGLFGASVVGAKPASATEEVRYTVTAEGITLPAGQVFQAHGHVNWRTTWARHGVHFDPNNGQPGGVYIGKSFLPFNLEPGECVEWTQVHGFDYHFGAQGEEPICKPKTPPAEDPKPEQPAPTTRTKVTEVCKAASRVTDHYSTPSVWSAATKSWVPGKEVWTHKTTEPMTPAECGYQTVVREKVTVDCKGGVKNLVITDFYVREWSFDAKAKAWVLGAERWSHKTKTPASLEQCPPPVVVEPTPEPTEPPTEEPTEPPVTEEPTEEPTEPPATEEPTEPTSPEPTEPPVTEEPTPVPSEPTTPTDPTEPEPEPPWTPQPSPTSPSSSPSSGGSSSPVAPSAPSVVSPPSSASVSSTPSTSASSRPSSVVSTPSRASSATVPELARTGTNPIIWVGLAGTLAVAGLAALAITRRKGDQS